MAPNVPPLPIHPKSWVAWTDELTFEEQGVCLRLLLLQWADGSIPNDLDLLRELTGGARISVITRVISAKFSSDERGGQLRLDTDHLVSPEWRERLNRTIEDREAASARSSAAANARWRMAQNSIQPTLENLLGEDPRLIEFKKCWGIYPSRAPHGNPRKAAFRAYCARTTAGVDHQTMYDGTMRYRRYTEIMCTEPNYIMQGVTFYGPHERFLEEWATPTGKGGPPTSSSHKARVTGA